MGHGDRYIGSLFRVDEPVPDDSENWGTDEWLARCTYLIGQPHARRLNFAAPHKGMGRVNAFSSAAYSVCR